MKKSMNQPIMGSNKKFYNTYKGKNENKYFFILPCITISPKKNLNWDMTVKSYFLAWGYKFIQINECEIVSDTSQELTKEYFDILKKSLKELGFNISDVAAALAFIKSNIYIVSMLRNSNMNHPYVKKVLVSYFQNQVFITT